MLRWLLLRISTLLLTLLGVTFVTFVVLDRAPVDRAELEIAKASIEAPFTAAVQREEAVQRLRVQYGMVDAVTGEPLPVWRRYAAWLGNALTLRLGGPGEDHATIWRRIGAALPVTLLIGGLAAALAVVLGMRVGVWLGRAVGRRRERLASVLLLAGYGVPEFLLATLLQLLLCATWLHLLPSAGLRSPGAENWSLPWQLGDFAMHLLLPVLVIAIGPFVTVTRFVRDAVARAERAPFATCLHALGVDDDEVRGRLWRHGATPVATLIGTMVPMLVSGSIVVESMFSLDGLGQLAFRALGEQQQSMIMALVLMTSVITLLSLLVSDLLHRALDARVRLRT
ncbi:MAG: ABC transporter permease [Planctomycetota bacterium]